MHAAECTLPKAYHSLSTVSTFDAATFSKWLLEEREYGRKVCEFFTAVQLHDLGKLDLGLGTAVSCHRPLGAPTSGSNPRRYSTSPWGWRAPAMKLQQPVQPAPPLWCRSNASCRRRSSRTWPGC
eukprot:2208573-Pleurochrysis_carterae.AAC.2